MTGRVIKAIKSKFSVYSEDKIYTTTSKGNLKNFMIKVGDIVDFCSLKNEIYHVHKRKNELDRPVISNVDRGIIVVSIKDPLINLYMLDKMISIFEYLNIEILIVFSKIDLEEKNSDLEIISNYYNNLGYKIYKINNHDFKESHDLINDKLTIVTGQSGVGKSSLLNNLDNKLNLKTDAISTSLKRGKNTTRHIELYKLGNGFIADSPGFSTMDLPFEDNSYLIDSFKEIFKYKHLCKFSNCTHNLETDCYIKEKVKTNEILESRYNNYLKFLEELKLKKRMKGY